MATNTEYNNLRFKIEPTIAQKVKIDAMLTAHHFLHNKLCLHIYAQQEKINIIPKFNEIINEYSLFKHVPFDVLYNVVRDIQASYKYTKNNKLCRPRFIAEQDHIPEQYCTLCSYYNTSTTLSFSCLLRNIA